MSESAKYVNFINRLDTTMTEIEKREAAEKKAVEDERKAFEHVFEIQYNGTAIFTQDENDCYVEFHANFAWHFWKARAALSQKPSVPKGWKIVPIEPDEAMIVAGFESAPDKIFDGENYPAEYDDMSGCQKAAFRAKRCYAAMLNAAPKPLCDPEWTSVKDKLPEIGQALKFMVPVKGYFTNAGTGLQRFVRENGKTHFVFSGAESDILWKPAAKGEQE